MNYKLKKNEDGEIACVLSSSNLAIPVDPLNTDYQAYLKWLAEGNEPIPADQE